MLVSSKKNVLNPCLFYIHIFIFRAGPIICSQNQCCLLNCQHQLQLPMINTKFSRLQVLKTCIARCNSNYCCLIPLFTVSLICCLNLQWLQIETIVVFLIIRSCNWFWQFNWPHWLWEQMKGPVNVNGTKFGHKMQEYQV